MMPAGKYYIGDLAYVMHGEWDEFCDLTIKGNSLSNGEFSLKDGRRLLHSLQNMEMVVILMKREEVIQLMRDLLAVSL